MTTTEGIAEGYLSECEDRVRSLEWQLNEATKANERLKQERDDAIDAEKIVLREIGAENERLRAAAQAVIDSINDENEIGPDAIFRLSQLLNA